MGLEYFGCRHAVVGLRGPYVLLDKTSRMGPRWRKKERFAPRGSCFLYHWLKLERLSSFSAGPFFLSKHRVSREVL